MVNCLPELNGAVPEDPSLSGSLDRALYEMQEEDFEKLFFSYSELPRTITIDLRLIVGNAKA
jgi:hypothetical protein